MAGSGPGDHVFRGERIFRIEEHYSSPGYRAETEITREVYEAERAAAAAQKIAEREAWIAKNNEELAAAQAEKAKLAREIARLRGKGKITIAQHDALVPLEARYQEVCMEEASALALQQFREKIAGGRRWPTPIVVPSKKDREAAKVRRTRVAR